MSIYPVIMCGGSGTRLWPASRTGRPKQFIPLIGERSSFQNTVLRVGEITGAARPVVIAGVTHRMHLGQQLKEIDRHADLLLEPEARDSCAAMAAAAEWIVRRDPGGVAVFVSADHHMPDAAAFAQTVGRAVEGAKAGKIVTLGLSPASPSTAFGYIQPAPGDGPVHDVAAFVEKPDATTAQRYIADGYLWNTGNFIVAAQVLIDELAAHAPKVLAAARAALDGAVEDGGALVLGDAFRTAPKISIDYAVMEKTTRAAVAPSAFEWLDIGAWDAVLAGSARDSEGNSGEGLFIAAKGNLLRTPPGTQAAMVGVSGLAVIVEDGAVLVADLSKAQGVKAAGEAFKGVAPPDRFRTLAEARAFMDRWMGTAVLPMWSSLGIDHERGGFREELTFGPEQPNRRGRVQPRQVWAFVTAGRKGWPGPWKAAVREGLDWFDKAHLRADGLYRALVDADGRAVDGEPKLYDQAFALLAWSATGDEERAIALLDRLEAWRHPAGGWRERGDHPFQANAHMHLFEAALAWEAVSKNPRWSRIADDVAALALRRFYDPEAGLIREFFNEDWTPAAGDDGRMIEPGHQFEWAHLLKTWAMRRSPEDTAAISERLYDSGRKGVDARRRVAVDGQWDDFSPRESMARFWPQTEWAKAAIALGREDDALAAFNAFHRYLHPEVAGVWFDKMTAEGELVPGPPPASTLYHIVGVWLALCGDGPVG